MSDVIERALAKAEKSYEYWSQIYEKASDDLHFLSDEEYAQWDARDAESRRKAGKPILTIDQLSQFVNQVSNDVRMNTPSINITPADGADDELAEIIEGLIRKIQTDSNADEVYDNAVNFAIRSSIGYMRVDHDYRDNETFDQDLKIMRVINPSSVLFDEESIEADGSDAKCCIVLDKVHVDKFKEEYSGKDPVSFEVSGKEAEKDMITLAEYFYVDEKPLWIGLTFEGNRVESDKELDPKDYQRVRKSTSRKVLRYKLSGKDVLEEGTFPGEYIPIVPVYGEEAWIDGKRNLYSLIRRSKDAQRMYNFWASLETELLMKAPKSPVVAVEGTTEDYAEDWINPDKAQVLRYKSRDNNNQPANPPQFVPPVQIPTGVVNARQSTTQDIRSTMGLYDSFLGQQDNAISGVAISGRQREGDRATFHFADNLVRSITQVGRILVSAIPVIYDTPRLVSIIGKEETNDLVGINGAFVEGQEREYDLTQGKYSVSVTTGANYATMRQEAAEFFERIFTSDPTYKNIMGDLLFKYSDFPGSDAMAERMKKLIDPQLLDEELDPQAMALQAQNQELMQNIELMQGQIAQLQQQLEDKQAELEIKMRGEQFDDEADKRKHRIEVAKLQLDEQRITGELAMKQKELELKAYEMGLKTNKQAYEQTREGLKEVAELTADVNERGAYD